MDSAIRLDHSAVQTVQQVLACQIFSPVLPAIKNLRAADGFFAHKHECHSQIG